jgi:hypothetical protein
MLNTRLQEDEMDDISSRKPLQAEYLGDGVYASFDGYQIWLHVGSHMTAPCVALEPRVLQSLKEYKERVMP